MDSDKLPRAVRHWSCTLFISFLQFTWSVSRSRIPERSCGMRKGVYIMPSLLEMSCCVYYISPYLPQPNVFICHNARGRCLLQLTYSEAVVRFQKGEMARGEVWISCHCWWKCHVVSLLGALNDHTPINCLWHDVKGRHVHTLLGTLQP